MPSIIVKTLTGRKLYVDYQEEDSILSLKQTIQEREGIPVDQIKFIYSGRQMNDKQKLLHYKVTPGGIVHMVLELR